MAGKNARGIATPGRPRDGEWEPEPKRRRRLNGANSRAAARSANGDGEQDGQEMGTEHDDDDRDELEDDRGTATSEGPKFPRNLNPAHHPVRLVLEERCQRCTERKSEYCSVAGAGGACLSCKVAKTSCSLSNSSRGHSNHLSRIAQANNPGWYLGMRNGAERALNDRSEARMRSRRRVSSLDGAAASRAPIDAERSSSNPGGHTDASASTSTTDQVPHPDTQDHIHCEVKVNGAPPCLRGLQAQHPGATRRRAKTVWTVCRTRPMCARTSAAARLPLTSSLSGRRPPGRRLRAHARPCWFRCRYLPHSRFPVMKESVRFGGFCLLLRQNTPPLGCHRPPQR
ncbi:hypothetical protein PHLGIDRAFT_253357 [Phlebiopsis gigantea 11061_1 CR5-6]|uniref:Uncharacterized protein n=1 Tax=Phlebiopsis gigantea (strain 11061_1 CR5-6) TaxID=745531 RepID=A0A0C3PD48_PHLG1|nr:hypothetical protein PHLGIDRAFT_253357 [Phlebiopsis gigantea 11061_1 CR5-6]